MADTAQTADEKDTTEVVVVRDAVGWRYWDERLRQYVQKYAFKGDKVHIPTADYHRMNDLAADSDGKPHVLTPEDHEAWTATEVTRVDPVMQLTDDQLMALPPDDLIARLQQVPGLAARVKPLEEARPKPRKPVLNVADRLMKASEGEDVSVGSTDRTVPGSTASTLTPSAD